jgi:hypothetical protein
MRVLIVGTTPPGGGAFARALALRATERREAGDDVEILSPDPTSAAHRTGRLDGLFLAARLAWASRRFDAVELRIEPGVPCRAETSRIVRAAYLMALGAALGCYSEVTLRPDTPIPIPGGLGGRAATGMWASAARIVVWTEEEEAMARRTPGVDPEALELAPRPSSSPALDRPWPSATSPDLREGAMEVVRARAERDRVALEARASVGAAAAVATRSSPSSLGVARVVAETAARRMVHLVRRVGR